MNKPQKFLIAFFAALFVLFANSLAHAQTASPQEPASSYEAMLYVILGTDDTSQRGDLPRSIAPITKHIRDNFAFANYRLMNTYLGRIANSGSLDYKSLSTLSAGDLDSPSFLDWQLTGIKASQNTLQMQLFRFGAKVPIRTATIVDGRNVINYETVGLTLNRINIAENSPTLVGTISLPKTTGTVFLVMAVRPV